MADTDQLISTFAMDRDPRLRRLFALVGQALADGDLSDVEDRLYGILLDLAPEYLPLDEVGGPDDDSQIVADWEAMIANALRAERTLG